MFTQLSSIPISVVFEGHDVVAVSGLECCFSRANVRFGLGVGCHGGLVNYLVLQTMAFQWTPCLVSAVAELYMSVLALFGCFVMRGDPLLVVGADG